MFCFWLFGIALLHITQVQAWVATGTNGYILSSSLMVAGNVTVQSVNLLEQLQQLQTKVIGLAHNLESLTQKYESARKQQIGTITSFTGDPTMIETGYLLCNGQTVSRNVYPELFSVIKVQFGAGDGTNTFHLPDLQNTYIFGTSNVTSLASKTGVAEVALTTENLPSHTHSFTGSGSFTTGIANAKTYRTVFGAGSGSAASPSHQVGWAPVQNYDRTDNQFSNADHTHNGDVTVSGVTNPPVLAQAKPFTIRPPSVALHFLIRYQ